MDQRKAIEMFFSGNKSFKKVNLPPPTSQKNLPQGIKGLYENLKNMKAQEKSKVKKSAVLHENKKN